jgi:hypothetical protein
MSFEVFMEVEIKIVFLRVTTLCKTLHGVINHVLLLFWHIKLHSSVGMARSYWLDGRGIGVWVPVGSGIVILHVVQTGSGVHPTSYPMGTGGSFPEVKRPAREADHSPPTSAEVKKTWFYTSTPLYAFMA